MKASEFLTEHKKSRRAKKYNVKPTAVAEPSKPRNFVAKNAMSTTSGAGAHKDKKKAAKQGDVKHKKKEMAEVSDELRNRYVSRASDDYGSANFAARSAKSHPGLEKYGKEQQARADKRAKGLGRALSDKRRGKVDEGVTTGNPEADKKILAIEEHITHLENLMPTVLKVSKDNHYVFESIEDEIVSIQSIVAELGDKGLDMMDSIEEAIQAIRQANGAVYGIEKTLKELIRNANMEIEDIESSEEWERRYGNKPEETNEGKNIPFAGAKVGHKEGPAGQWRNKGPKAKKPAKPGDLVG